MIKNPYVILLLIVFCLSVFFETAPLFSQNMMFLHTILAQQMTNNALSTAACMGGFLAYCLMFAHNRKELTFTLVLGVIFEFFLIRYRLSFVSAFGQIVCIGPGLLAASLLSMMLCTVEKLYRRDYSQVEKNLEVIGLAVAMPLFLAFNGFVGSQETAVYDAYIYALDSIWGTQPSFLITGALRSSKWLHLTMYFIYMYLPIWMLLAQVFIYKDNERLGLAHNKNLIPALSFILIAVTGAYLYKFFPAVGVEAYCGTRLFPYGQWPAANLAPSVIEAPPFLPRNCMPSLHMAWIMAACVSIYRAKPTYKLVGIALVVLTALSTFSIGCHYLSDLIISFPFCLAIMAITMPEASANIRVGGALFGTVATLGWMYLFKYHVTAILHCHVVAAVALIVTDLISLWLLYVLCTRAKHNIERANELREATEN